MLDKLTHSHFRKHLNATFTVATGAKKTQKWKLIEVNQLRSDSGNLNRHPFSLLFSGPGGSPVAQGVYKVKHAGMKNMEILVVPVAAEGGKEMHYEAIFN